MNAKRHSLTQSLFTLGVAALAFEHGAPMQPPEPRRPLMLALFVLDCAALTYLALAITQMVGY